MDPITDILSIISAPEDSLLLPEPPSLEDQDSSLTAVMVPSTVTGGEISEVSRRHRWAFIRAWDPEEVMIQAAALPFREWMDYFIKLSPKELQVKGHFEMRSLVAQLGPIERRGE
jgi:hypothetical protein